MYVQINCVPEGHYQNLFNDFVKSVSCWAWGHTLRKWTQFNVKPACYGAYTSRNVELDIVSNSKYLPYFVGRSQIIIQYKKYAASALSRYVGSGISLYPLIKWNFRKEKCIDNLSYTSTEGDYISICFQRTFDHLF